MQIMSDTHSGSLTLCVFRFNLCFTLDCQKKGGQPALSGAMASGECHPTAGLAAIISMKSRSLRSLPEWIHISFPNSHGALQSVRND
jgi:hypothetical protein